MSKWIDVSTSRREPPPRRSWNRPGVFYYVVSQSLGLRGDALEAGIINAEYDLLGLGVVCALGLESS